MALIRTNLLLLLTVVCCVVSAARLGAQAESIEVDDHRPLSKALYIFESRYGWVVTYEDPRYVSDADIMDVTRQVRRSPDPSKPPVLVPRGGSLTFSFARPATDSSPEQVVSVVRSLLTQYEASGLPGTFAVMENLGTLHVIPTSILGGNRQPIAQGSILDAVVSLPEEKGRTSYAALQAAIASVAAATGQIVWLSTVPVNLLTQSKMEEPVEKEPARQLIMKILKSTGRGLSWRLLYDPGLKLYMFSVHPVT